MTTNETKYLLAMKRDNKDYLPIELNLTKFYNGEDINKLSGIDELTSKFDEIDLIEELLSQNIVTLDDKYRSFVIIFSEKGRFRELKESPCFKSNYYLFDENIITTFILENIDNKSILNNIINLCETKFKAKETLEFSFILKNINHFVDKGENAVKIALNHYYEIPYEEKRKLSYYISTKIIKDLS